MQFAVIYVINYSVANTTSILVYCQDNYLMIVSSRKHILKVFFESITSF
jgi:threonine aldolase